MILHKDISIAISTEHRLNLNLIRSLCIISYLFIALFGKITEKQIFQKYKASKTRDERATVFTRFRLFCTATKRFIHLVDILYTIFHAKLKLLSHVLKESTSEKQTCFASPTSDILKIL